MPLGDPLGDPLDDVEFVIAYASHVIPTHRARAFLQYAEKTLAGPGGPDTVG